MREIGPDEQILASRTRRIAASFEAISAYVDDILNEIFQAGICGPEAVTNSSIVLTEVLNNIVEHGYAGRPGEIEVRSALTEDKIIFQTTDSGVEMPGLAPPDPACPEHDVALEALPEGHFGWFMIRSLSDEIRYLRNRGKNHLQISLARAA